MVHLQSSQVSSISSVAQGFVLNSPQNYFEGNSSISRTNRSLAHFNRGRMNKIRHKQLDYLNECIKRGESLSTQQEVLRNELMHLLGLLNKLTVCCFSIVF